MRRSFRYTEASPFGRIATDESHEAELFFEELTGISANRHYEEAWPAGGSLGYENFDGDAAMQDDFEPYGFETEADWAFRGHEVQTLIEQNPVSQRTQDARRRFPAMYQQFRTRLTQAEQQAIQTFMQGWSLPSACPFTGNSRLTRKEKAVLAGAMLAAGCIRCPNGNLQCGVKGTDCGDWVMRAYTYSQGDPYISRRDWRNCWSRQRVPFRHPEHRWNSLAWAGSVRPAGGGPSVRTAVHPRNLSRIEPGCWVMYTTRPGHSILITRVIPNSINTNAGTIRVEALESGANIIPRYRTMTLNCGTVRNGIRVRKLGSIFSIQIPQRKNSYISWLQQQRRSSTPSCPPTTRCY